MPRPHQLDPSLGILTASSNGFPSGAAQSSILLSGILIKEWSCPLKWIIAPIYVVIICISRMYLGLHFPLDIIGGLGIGALLLMLYLYSPSLQRLNIQTLKKGLFIFMSSSNIALLAIDPTVFSNEYIEVSVPEQQPLHDSLIIQSSKDKNYTDWTDKEDRSLYKIIRIATGILEDPPFLVYGKESFENETPYTWLVVPFEKKSNIFSRYFQQLKAAWRLIVQPHKTSEDALTRQVDFFQNRFYEFQKIEPEPSIEKSDDPFCNDKVIENQLLYEGKTVNVLYDYRPIGPTHILIVPKAHRDNFRQLTEEEYLEAAKLSRFVVQKLRETNEIHAVYHLHKTGSDAGQSVKHFHWHLIIADNSRDDLFNRLKFLWRMTFGSSPLSQNELQNRVEYYRNIFNS